jgi:5'(3')-deoxyribonucleotidase
MIQRRASRLPQAEGVVVAKRRLGIDIDNCVASTDAVIRQILRDVTNGRVNLQYEEICEFDYHGPLCCDANGERIDERTWKEVHNRFSEPNVVLSIEPIPGAVEAIQALQSDFEIHFVTTRKPQARAATIHWLDRQDMAKHRPYSVHFVAHREKHEVLSNLAAAIDDDLAQATLFAEHGVRSILLAHPWNQASDGSLERVPSWRDILRLLKKEIPQTDN